MVFPDLSAPETKPQKNKSAHQSIASISDRFIALILDFLIFSPIVSLFIAGLVRQTKTYFLLNVSSQEGMVAAGLVVALIVFFVTLLQTVFLYYWQATPGQLFLQLKVVGYPHEQERLTLNQCLLRAFSWCLGFLAFAVPYLEIASHPLRRAFHERVSDTMVITLKKTGDEGPYPLEMRFLSAWMRMSFLFLLLFGVLGFFKTYHSLMAGHYREEDKATALACKEIKESDSAGTSRLDVAIAMFLLNEIPAECLDKEAEASLWSDSKETRSLAYLAKYMIADGKAQDQYFDKACEDRDASSCALARYLGEDGEAEDLVGVDNKLLTARLLQSEEKFTKSDFIGSLKLIEDLQKVPGLKAGLEKRFVRSVWALRGDEVPTANSGRMPASAEKDSWIETFKERYEVP
ncbi:RDD family protein [Bdellovibrio bacteriovorus]|uniref:RDD family protein n=1 Tax=Bdellovibrio bacteriovorus TaxID=959 RepID=UPI0035A5BA79